MDKENNDDNDNKQNSVSTIKDDDSQDIDKDTHLDAAEMLVGFSAQQSTVLSHSDSSTSHCEMQTRQSKRWRHV